jgi:hypothetical protein
VILPDFDALNVALAPARARIRQKAGSIRPVQPYAPHPVVQAVPVATPRRLPTPLRVLLVAMGVCSPGGLLFLLALVFNSNVNLDKMIWYILATIGGAGAFYLQRRLAMAS